LEGKEEYSKMDYTKICKSNRAEINQFIKEHWYSTKMVVRGQEFDMSEMEGEWHIMEDKLSV